MGEVTIRGENGDLLRITLLGRSHPGATDFWDGNWLWATVEVRAGAFRGSVCGDLRADELFRFLRQLVTLQESLGGTAEFQTMEGWLSLRLVGDGQGHMACRCVLRDKPGIGNALECTLTTDQTFIRETAAQLAAAVQAFPVIGEP